MSDGDTSAGVSERSADVDPFPFNVRNRHHLKITKRGAHNVIPKEWQCRGCEERFTKKYPDPCENPTVWVQAGCPGDGLGRCNDCDALFVFEYGQRPFYENTCPECDSIDWYRTDETDAELGEIIGLSDTDSDRRGDARDE